MSNIEKGQFSVISGEQAGKATNILFLKGRL
jgi:hypothetical protein